MDLLLVEDEPQIVKLLLLHLTRAGFSVDAVITVAAATAAVLQRRYDVVVLDPPKLIRSRDEIEDGRRKYYDFNRLAMQLVAPDGILLTCSCSGLLDLAEFSKIVCAAPEFGRRVQVLMKGGAAADHPIATICPESEYLKTMWLRLE